jgi:hypothetical protein
MGAILCKKNGCDGEMLYLDDNCGLLTDEGSSCEIYQCDTCGRIEHFQIPD